MPDALDRIVAALAGSLFDVDAHTIADALWLAATSVPAAPRRDAVETPEDRPEAVPPLPHHPAIDHPVLEQPARPAAAVDAGVPLFEPNPRTGTVRRGLPVTVPTPNALPASAAIARALRPFTRRWRHGHGVQLDVDATVERYAENRTLVPVLRPAPERWFDVVLVVDSAPAMAVWRDTVRAFHTLLAELGVFRAVHTWTLSAGDSRVVVRDNLCREFTLKAAESLVRVPDARRLVLVVSDFAAENWRRAPLWELVSAWARTVPTAIIDPLPMRFWQRSGLDLPAVRVTTTGQPGAATSFRYRLPPRARVAGDLDEWLPVPALALSPGSLARWARALVRADPAGCDAVLVPTGGQRMAPAAAVTAPAESSVLAAEAYVRTASAAAVRLALLCAPFERFTLSLVRLLHAHAVPDAVPADLAELLVSGLVRIVEPARPEPVLAFQPQIREWLLGYVTTHDVWAAHQALTAFIAEHPAVSPRMAAFAHTAAGRAELPTELRFFAEATTDTLRLLGVIPDEERAFATMGRSDSEVAVLPQEAAMDDVDDTPVLPGTPVTRSVPQVWGGVPPRNRAFTGREFLLEQIWSTLDDDTARPAQQPLIGLGGIGKTQVVAEYAHRYQSDYSLVWWIVAEDERAIRRSLTALARRLDLAVTNGDVQDVINTVLEVLRVGEPHERWLLIFDNASEPASVQQYMPSGPGHVLITSRDRSWASVANVIEIDTFTEEESLEFLRRGWPELAQDEALALADKLGRLPLALEQAVAVHRQTGMPFADYVGHLERNPRDILSEGAPAMYPNSLVATVVIAFDSLRRSSPDAAYLLGLCAFLSSQPISVPLLMRGRAALSVDGPKDELWLRRTVRDLGRYSLVRLDTGRDLVSVNGLVRTVLRGELPADRREELERTAHTVLALANPGAPTEPATWPQHSQIAPHVVSSGLVHSLVGGVRRLVVDQIRYHLAIGDYVTARNLGTDVVDVWRATAGPDEDLTLLASRYLGEALRMTGEYAAARRLNLDVSERMSRSLGENHEMTLDAMGSVGVDLRLAGAFDEARRLDETSLSRHRQVLGDGDPNTVRALLSLATDHRLLGRFAEALVLDEEAVRLCEEIHGTDDPRTHLAYAGVARDRCGLGDYRSALRLTQEKALASQQLLPTGHADVLAARQIVAVLLRRTGAAQEALRQATDLVAVSGHGHAVAALVTQANAYRAVRDHGRAAALDEDALALSGNVFGTGHPFTLACQVNIAISHRLIGDHDRARHAAEEALTGLTAALGERHPDTLRAANTKANLLAATGQVDDARRLSQQTLANAHLILGQNHPDTLAYAVNQAAALEATGDNVAGTELRAVTLRNLLRTLGADHPTTLSTQHRLDTEIDIPII